MQPDHPDTEHVMPDVTEWSAAALKSIASESVPKRLLKAAQDLQTALELRAETQSGDKPSKD